MDFKETFLKLTEYTIPYGDESKLEKYLPKGYKKDSVGNYYIEVGNSETLFTTHLDTYSAEYQKVNHVIDGDIIKTDGTTILGGDNKLGMTILLKMIERNIPGTYYFFIGEEPILSGGLFGSGEILDANPSYFKKFKRAIAFDRKEKGSIVTRQKADWCCSKEFANELSKRFTDLGVDSKPDPNAYYTDTATFMDTIPECTNISAGGWKEHFAEEWVDLSYTKKVLEVACKIDWESLPVGREIKLFEPKFKLTPMTRFKNTNVIKGIKRILGAYNLLHTNQREFETYNSDTLVFNTWFEQSNIRITVLNTIKVEIEGRPNIELELTDLNGLNLYFIGIFGADIPYTKYKMKFYQDDTFSVLDTDFESMDHYLEHFDIINNDDTSYVIKKGGEQYKDSYGSSLDKSMVFLWFDSNFY